MIKRSVLVLVCGLPAAGKTTLVKHLVARGSTRSMLYERISFDDLFELATTQDTASESTDFDPDKWKSCQQEMVMLVSNRLILSMAKETTQQLVLLVDDNFQYGSLRKRFYHLAIKLDCGFAVLYMNLSPETCRQRNTARRGAAQVPVEVFERMLDVFEAPNGHQNAWEVNSLELTDTDDGANIDEVMDTLLQHAERERQDRCSLHVANEKKQAEQLRDRLTTQQNVLHLVDLQLRQWISAQLQDETSLSPGMTKAKLASQLNQRRKDYLRSLKSSLSSQITGLLEGESIEQTVVSLIRRFQQQK